MSLVDIFARFRVFMLRRKTPIASFIQIKGPISSQTTYHVGQVLQRIPKTTKKLSVIINSAGGQVSQAVIIAEQLKRKTKQMNIQLITFAQQFALNSAFYLLTVGDRVYADNTTCIGGVQVGKSKYNFGSFSNYFKTIVYAEDSSYIAQFKKDEPFQQPKASELKQIYSLFSQDLKRRIQQNRRNKLKNIQKLDLLKIMYGEQALNFGLIDGIGRIHETIPKILPNSRIQSVEQNQVKKIVKIIKNIQLKR